MDKKPRVGLTDSERITIWKRKMQGESTYRIAKDMERPKSTIRSALESNTVKRLVEMAQKDLLETLPKATSALSGLITDYSDKKTRKKMDNSEKHRAWMTCVKLEESIGVLSTIPSANITNIYSQQNINVSPQIMNIISDSIRRQLDTVENYQEVDYEDINNLRGKNV